MTEPEPTPTKLPFSVDIDMTTGAMPEGERLIRKTSAMKGHYADKAAFQALVEGGDPLHYEVFEVHVSHEPGQLRTCISKLQPGVVGDECFMTKGHYHKVAEAAEVYLCLAGEGYMLMKTSDGQCAAEKMTRGKMVYVPPFWAHRSVNTGDVPLVSFCVYPAEAGHNYGDIETQAFPKRIYKRGGEIVIE